MKRILSLALLGLVVAASVLSAEKKPRVNPQIAGLGEGQSVRLKTSSPAPAGRGFCARMPYDPARKVGLVYGACHNPGRIAQNDVWSFDASTATWTELIKTDPRKQPMKLNKFGVSIPVKGDPRPAGVGHTYNVICFDSHASKLVSLRGGTPRWLGSWAKYRPRAVSKAKAAGVSDEQIKSARRCLPWLFDVGKRKWELAAPETGDTPNHTRAEACVYDPKHKKTLYWSVDVIAQRKGGVFAYDAETNVWKFSATKGGPASGIEPLACWDSVNQRVLYFSGSYTKTRQVKSFDYATLTWTDLKAKGWPKLAKAHPKRGPYVGFASGGSSLAFDSHNGVALFFRAEKGKVSVHPYNTKTNAFEKAGEIKWNVRGHIKSYFDPDQNAVIINGGGDLGKSQTWAYRYKRAGKK
jgi:Galactose oxidase, central domain